MNPNISLRPIRPDDVERLQAFHRRLSPEAVRLRFHGYLRELPNAMAKRFCNVDGQNRVAFVATSGDPEQIVGVGRFDVIADAEAEVAFVVADAYQRRGIGTRLLEKLIESARERGIRVLRAWVLPGNSAMRQLLVQTGYPMEVRRGFGGDTLKLHLPD